MRRVFADTFYWLALSSPTDQWREAVLKAVTTLDNFSVVTTEEVLTEFLAGMAGRGDYQRTLAIRMVRSILSDEDMTVLPQTHQSFLEGLDLYEHRVDKGYSLTDCISMNACRQEAITEVLTSDHHFAQEGLVVLISQR
jgi:predicted nucleic acid-binding protein